MIQNREIRIAAMVLLIAAFAGDASAQRSSFRAPTKAAKAVDIAGQPAHYEIPSGFEASDFVFEARCSRNRPVKSDIRLSWIGGLSGRVRMDITGYADGFTTGRYVTSGARGSGDFHFLEGEAGVNYYWRLLEARGDSWAVRAHGRFVAPTCPSDDL